MEVVEELRGAVKLTLAAAFGVVSLVSFLLEEHDDVAERLFFGLKVSVQGGLGLIELLSSSFRLRWGKVSSLFGRGHDVRLEDGGFLLEWLQSSRFWVEGGAVKLEGDGHFDELALSRLFFGQNTKVCRCFDDWLHANAVVYVREAVDEAFHLGLAGDIGVLLGSLVCVGADDDFDLILVPQLLQLVELEVVAG